MVRAIPPEAYEPPALGDPSPREQEAVQALSGRLRSLVGSAFAPATAALHEAEELLPGPLPSGPWALVATWAAGPSWQLLLSAEAAEVLLAAALGQESLEPHPLTDLDLRLLRLPVAALATAVAGDAAPASRTPELALARHAAPLELAVAWPLRLGHAALAGEAVLAADWPGLRALFAPPAGDRRPRPEQFDDVPVGIEATLSGAPLTPRELMALAPGDVMIFGGDLESALSANGVVFARGRLGAKGARLAISLRHLESSKEE